MRHWLRRRPHAIGRTPLFGICGNLRNLCTNTRPRTSRDEVGNHGPHAVYLARRCQAVGFSTECQKMTLRTDADSDSEVSGPKSPDSPSPVWAMPPPRGRLEAWCSGHSFSVSVCAPTGGRRTTGLGESGDFTECQKNSRVEAEMLCSHSADIRRVWRVGPSVGSGPADEPHAEFFFLGGMLLAGPEFLQRVVPLGHPFSHALQN